jgi:hypothetical protein
MADRLSDAFDSWEPWLDLGSWLVLIAGVGGVAFRAFSSLAFDVSLDRPFLFWLSVAGHGLVDVAKVGALFLILRLLIVGVPVLLELHEGSVGDEEAGEDPAEAQSSD